MGFQYSIEIFIFSPEAATYEEYILSFNILLKSSKMTHGSINEDECKQKFQYSIEIFFVLDADAGIAKMLVSIFY